MTDRHRELRTTLARLELVASASAAVLDASPGRSTEHPGGKRPPGSGVTADQWYRDRLRDLDAGRPRRVTDKHGRKQRDTYERLLEDARTELERLTGRDGKAPGEHKAAHDKPGELARDVIEQGIGWPVADVALKFKLTNEHVRKLRRQGHPDHPEIRYEPENGMPTTPPPNLTVEDRRRQAAALRERNPGISERQVALHLRVSHPTVLRDSKRAA